MHQLIFLDFELVSLTSKYPVSLGGMLDLETWVSGSILTGGNILLLEFFFSRSKDSDANIGIIAILVHFEKNSSSQRGKFLNKYFFICKTGTKLLTCLYFYLRSTFEITWNKDSSSFQLRLNIVRWWPCSRGYTQNDQFMPNPQWDHI